MRCMFGVIKLKKRYITLALFAISFALSFTLGFRDKAVFTLAMNIRDAAGGKIVAIDPGHGGIDGGATGKGGVVEKVINLDISKALKNTLNGRGIYTVMTRETDVDILEKLGIEISGPRKRKELTQRVELVKEANADLFVSIHANSFNEPQWSGAQVFYNDDSLESKVLAEFIQQALINELGNNSRKPKSADFLVLNKLEIPSVLIEVGFLSNPREEKLLANSEYQIRIAKAISEGIVNYYLQKKDQANSKESKETLSLFTQIDAEDEVVPSKTDVVLMYFGCDDDSGKMLVPVQREIPGLSDMTKVECIKTVVDQLIIGPSGASTFKSVLPEGTVLREVKLVGDVAVVNLSEEFFKNQTGGSYGEIASIYSIVNTLTSLEFVKSVKIVVDDGKDTVLGHIDIDMPLEQRKL